MGSSRSGNIKKIVLSYQKTPQDDKIAKQLADIMLPQIKAHAGSVFLKSPPGVEYKDVFEYCLIGMFDAAIKFREKYNVTFDTYAEKRIKGAAWDGIRKEVPGARNVGVLRTKLGQLLYDHHSYEELRELSSFGKSKFESAIGAFKLQEALYLSEPMGERITLGDYLQDKKDGFLDRLVDRDYVERLTRGLLENEKNVIYLYYAGYTLREIGEKFLDLSETRISQIFSSAKKRVKYVASILK